MTRWICIVSAGTHFDGDVGGQPWAVNLIRADALESQWQILNCRILSEEVRAFEDGQGVLRAVLLNGSDDFVSFAHRNNLSEEIFGSPTLWPPAHRDFSDSWVWVIEEPSANFPFLS